MSIRRSAGRHDTLRVDDDRGEDLGDPVELRRRALLEVALLALQEGAVVGAGRDHGIGGVISTPAVGPSRLHDELVVGGLVERLGELLVEAEADREVHEDRGVAEVTVAGLVDGERTDGRVDDAHLLAVRQAEDLAAQTRDDGLILLEPALEVHAVVGIVGSAGLVNALVEVGLLIGVLGLQVVVLLLERGVGVALVVDDQLEDHADDDDDDAHEIHNGGHGSPGWVDGRNAYWLTTL